MEIPNKVDIAFTNDGDIKLYEANHELQYSNVDEVVGIDVIIQNIKHRIKSVKPDWFYDHIGANLEQIIGKENSRETAEAGVNLIIEALTEGGFIGAGDIYIRPIPSDAFTIVYYLAVRLSDEDAIAFNINIALNAGINIEEA